MATKRSNTLSALQVAVLKNAPGRNAAVERALLKSKDALNTALEAIGGHLRPGAFGDMQRILKVALNLSRAKGRYEGLRDGYRLHEFSIEIEEDAASRSLLRRINKFPKGHPEVTAENLCKYLDGEIERLHARDGQPFPPAKWGIGDRQVNPWRFALKGPDEKMQQRASTYLSRMRDKARGEDYSFIVAWEELSRSMKGTVEKAKEENEPGIGLSELKSESSEAPSASSGDASVRLVAESKSEPR
jgi:hypothetical protein